MATATFPQITSLTVTPSPVGAGASLKITAAVSEITLTTYAVSQISGYLTAYAGQAVPVSVKN